MDFRLKIQCNVVIQLISQILDAFNESKYTLGIYFHRFKQGI